MRPVKNGTNQVEADADVGHAFVAALSGEQIDDPMSTILSEVDRVNYGSDANVKVTIAKIAIKRLIR